MTVTNRQISILGILVLYLSAGLVAVSSSASTATEEEVEFKEEHAYEEVSEPYIEKLELARSFVNSNEFSAAEQTLELLVAEIEEERTRYAPELTEPLKLLGQSLHGKGDYPAAVDAFERAIHILRINEGLHSPQQAAIIYAEAETLLAMGDPAGANSKAEYAYEMLERSYGYADIRLLPGMYKLAEWYMRNRNIFSARTLYGEAVLLLSKTYGDSSPELLPALNGIANSYLTERFPPYSPPQKQHSISIQSGGPRPAPVSQRPTAVVNRFSKGEKALQHGVRIRVDDPDSTTAEKAEAIVKLADWYLLFQKEKRAVSLYLHARELLESDTTSDQSALLQAYFDTPIALYLPLPTLALPPIKELQAASELGFVELTYDLSKAGKVRNLKTIASQPSGMMDLKVRRALKTARYRPRITAEGLQPEFGLTLRHEFRYYPRLEASSANAQANKD